MPKLSGTAGTTPAVADGRTAVAEGCDSDDDDDSDDDSDDETNSVAAAAVGDTHAKALAIR